MHVGFRLSNDLKDIYINLPHSMLHAYKSQVIFFSNVNIFQKKARINNFPKPSSEPQKEILNKILEITKKFIAIFHHI